MNTEQQRLVDALGWTADTVGLVQLHRSAACGNGCKFEVRLGSLAKMEVPAAMRVQLLPILEKHAMIPCTLFSKTSRNLRPIIEELKVAAAAAAAATETAAATVDEPAMAHGWMRDRTALEWITFLKKAEVARFYSLDSQDRKRPVPISEFIQTVEAQ